MKVLGIYTSPRKRGNSDVLLDQTLKGAEDAGAEVQRVYCRKLKMSGCIECGGCEKTGECVVKDDMQSVYPLLDEADAIVLSAPIFFYSLPAQGKALIDRTQARWAKRMLTKTREERKSFDSGKGYLVAVGATKGKNLFMALELIVQYFYDALDMSFEGGLNVRGVDSRGDINNHSETLNDAYELGKSIVAKGV
jgi:multimeric flavodoxin WrbA